MRLTLRTLLAYLDDVLEPSDKEELRKKIESSGFAEDLVLRTRDTMRRLRLSAPQVMGSGMGLDPNTVAEYLDSTLPPDHFGDFERICLESDVHLAEVASCHHVLTMVLGEPADIDPVARQRMYSIPEVAAERKKRRVEPSHAVSVSPLAAAVPVRGSTVMPIASIDQSRTVEIPDYLRAAGWSRYRGMLMAVAAALLVGATLFLFSDVGNWFRGGPTTPVVAVTGNGPGGELPGTANPSAQAATQVAPAATTAAVGEVAKEGSSSDVSAMVDAGSRQQSGSAPPAGVAAPLASPPQPWTPGISSPSRASTEVPDRYAVSSSAAGATSSPDGLTADFASQPEAAETRVEPPSPYDVLPTDPGLGTPVPAVVRVPDESMRPPGVAASGLKTEPKTVEEPRVATLPSDAGRGAPELPAAVSATPLDKALVVKPAPDLGTYLGVKSVLLRYDGKLNSWFRVTPRDAVVAGDKLLALPEFRPTIALTSGVQLDMLGGTLVALGTADGVDGAGLPMGDVNQPAVEIVYGRALLTNTANANKMVRLTVGTTTADVQLAPKATLAVEVQRNYVPGRDPRKTPAPVNVALNTSGGEVRWQQGAEGTPIVEPSTWTIIDGVASVVVPSEVAPKWIDPEPGNETADLKFGAPVVEGTLTSDRPADLQLLEMFQTVPRREVKSLAARSCIHVDLFEPFVVALRDTQQRTNWPTHIDALRAAMALRPESAEKVWESLVKSRGQSAAANMYEMLCGYDADQIGRTPEQRKSGALSRLLDWLESDKLEYRVLAVHDMGEITGTHLVDPTDRPKDRAQAVRRLRTRLDAGDLRPLTQP